MRFAMRSLFVMVGDSPGKVLKKQACFFNTPIFIIQAIPLSHDLLPKRAFCQKNKPIFLTKPSAAPIRRSVSDRL
jgi:hypothetical protein